MMVAEFLPHQCEIGDLEPLPELVSCMQERKSLAPEEKKGPWGGKASRQLVHLDISFETPSHTGLRTAELVGGYSD
jgi:hypothetical protein